MFIKICAEQACITNHDDACLVENKRINGKVKPLAKAADAEKKAKSGDERRDGVSVSGERLRSDLSLFRSFPFHSLCRGPSREHFTRNRKLPLNHLILSIFNRKGLSLSMEIRGFSKLLESRETPIISNAGYLKQRLKLNPAAFLVLSDFHVRNFYRDEPDLLKFNDHYIFAVDGSDVNLPNTPENRDWYGFERNQSGQHAQAKVSCLYDVFNRMILDCTINPCKVSERALVEAHLDKIPSFIGNQPYVVVLDRGYPSGIAFLNRLEKHQNFVVRLSGSDFTAEQRQMASDDEEVEIVFTPTRLYHYRKTPEAQKRLKEQGSIRLRFVKVALPDGTTEFLATNLSRETWPQQEISELYRLRWKIETAYDILKNKFMLENFTGKKAIIIEQDILSTIYLYNITQDMIRDAEMKQQEKNASKHYKHKMTINVNLAIGIIKEDLIRMLLEKDAAKKGAIFKQMINEIAGNIVPVRENRHFSHQKKHPAIKYSMTKKRSY